MEYQNTYRDGRGTEITIRMKTRCSNVTEMAEALQLVYACSSRFYLDALDTAAGAVKEDDHISICPVCGMTCTTVYYRGRYNDIVGCNRCISPGDASEEAQCFPHETRDIYGDLISPKTTC